MNTLFQKISYSYFSLIIGAAWLYPVNVSAEVSAHTMTEFTSFPLLTTAAPSVTPMVMINSSIDHQLYFKVYNDYTDLDGDGERELSYKHDINYYGYFDSYKCYSYNSSAATANHGTGRFDPDSITADKYCGGTTWSGNFLNWATMHRIDAIRKILFGGHRRIDSATQTVLERTYLPNDAHSSVKYYASTATEINKLTPVSGETEITICNTTESSTTVSEDVTDPPLMRVAIGNHSLWAANERWQCRWGIGTNANDSTKSGINASSSSPELADNDNNGDYTVRVNACVKNKIGKENCKLYPGADQTSGTDDDVYKPIGLFQVYGDDDRLWFGMMGGSFSKNKSGGTLIKDIGSIADEINVTTDGTFKKVGIYASDNGVTDNTAFGLINAWSVHRIIKYKHSDGTYGTSTTNNNNCPWGINTFNDGQCQNWGNPFSEIYLNSVRYFAGESVSGTFRSNDSNEIQALQTPQTFQCPLDSTNYCARLNIINFNSSVISYDYDQLDDNSDGVGAIWTGETSKGLTDVVGDGENITGNDYFVGELIGGSGTDINGLCTSKTVASFGDVLGLCSEAPRLDGSYRIAGIAHKAHISDIRSSGVNELEGDQTIETYSVALASAVPRITLKVPNTSKTVTLLPACQNTEVGGNCALVDFKVVEPYDEEHGVARGKLYINWEDSEQGGDFDQDMWGTLDYEISSSTLTIITDVHAESTPYPMGFGYVLSGTTNDGYHAHSGIEGYNYSTECSSCNVGDAATTRTYAIGESTAKLLEDPLYYAAKWGGFEDSNDNDIPDVQAEWDEKINLTGELGQDGVPDNYFFATNPVALEAALIRVFDDILSKTASGTAAAVVANSREGVGAIYQATYVTSRDIKNNDGTTDSVKWYGQLHSLWIDSFGFMREDTNNNAVLDDYQTDLVIDLIFSEVDRKTRITRYGSCEANSFVLGGTDDCTASPFAVSENNDISTIKPIWNGRKQLSAVTDFTTQRTYSSLASTGRHILTWIDADLDDVVDSGEVVNLDTTDIDSSNFRFFDVADETTADKVTNFIRGEAVSGYRNRLADIDSDGTKEQLVLGDIVNSTPTPVATPAEAFDLLYNDIGDGSYEEFRKKYKNRRTVIYTGANDGLLHAFNGGYFVRTVNNDNTTTNKFETSRTTTAFEIPASTTTTAHPLGAELWAYAPKNLLPHLKWLTDTDYTHVYYMDNKPRVFDAKIFANDATHPGGWGTVLVAGMRFGGGDMTIDTDGDGLGANNTDTDEADDITTRSAYVVMDITNPEEPPTVLAEITHPDAGFSTSYPTAFTIRKTDESVNKWYLAFGSGPTNLATGVSDQNGRLYIYDLLAKDFVDLDTGDVNGTGNIAAVLSEATSFVGDPVSVDWDLSYKADALYFGTSAGTDPENTPSTGKMYKMKINKDPDPANWSAPEVFYDAGRPSLVTPTVSFDRRGNHWVFWGTGRLYSPGDLLSSEQQYIYGLKDVEDIDEDTNNNGIGEFTEGNVTLATYTWDIQDVTDILVFTDASITGIDLDNNNATDENFFGLVTYMEGKDGWRKDLPANGTDPSERVLTTSALIGSVLFTSAYEPGTNLCNTLGNSDLYGLYFGTGTGLPPSVLGTVDHDNDDTTPDLVLDHIDIGHGIASSPSIHTGEGIGDSGVTVVTQTGVGAIDRKEAQVEAGVRSGEMSWRHLYQ